MTAPMVKAGASTCPTKLSLRFFQEMLDLIVATRVVKQVGDYRQRVPPPDTSLKKRVESLAAIRTDEGYMAESIQESRDSYLLVEHHCPICDAAKSCLGLCQAEWVVFRRVLGEDVIVDRLSHVAFVGSNGR